MFCQRYTLIENPSLTNHLKIQGRFKLQIFILSLPWLLCRILHQHWLWYKIHCQTCYVVFNSHCSPHIIIVSFRVTHNTLIWHVLRFLVMKCLFLTVRQLNMSTSMLSDFLFRFHTNACFPGSCYGCVLVLS